MSNDSSYESLQSNIPANIDIEEMIVGRFTFKQLIVLLIAGALIYKTGFKMDNTFLRVSLPIIIAITSYLLGFYKLKKYNRYLSEHLYYIIKYKNEQQIFLSKR